MINLQMCKCQTKYTICSTYTQIKLRQLTFLAKFQLSFIAEF